MAKINLKFKAFEKTGLENTDEALKLAKENADILGVKDIVIASTRGFTAKKAAELFDPSNYNLVIITHSYGFRDNTPQEFEIDLKNELELNGVKIYSGTLAFSGFGSALKNTYQFWDFSTLYARTIRTIFCDGVKVCHEIVLMASDAGLVKIGNDVISVGGTGQGSDTVCLIKAASSRKFFDARIKAILAKPL
ncbi:MAG: pyruvate kinase alpha/beta domain-containing protein [Promethearchaeota archaeon]